MASATTVATKAERAYSMNRTGARSAAAPPMLLRWGRCEGGAARGLRGGAGGLAGLLA